MTEQPGIGSMDAVHMLFDDLRWILCRLWQPESLDVETLRTQVSAMLQTWEQRDGVYSDGGPVVHHFPDPEAPDESLVAYDVLPPPHRRLGGRLFQQEYPDLFNGQGEQRE